MVIASFSVQRAVEFSANRINENQINCLSLSTKLLIISPTPTKNAPVNATM